MENVLTKSNMELLDRIVEKAKDKKIPFNEGKNILGFGKFEGFYMFYIRIIDEKLIIRLRKEYKKDSTNNLIEFEITKENLNDIYKSIDNIVESLLLTNPKEMINDEIDYNIDFENCLAYKEDAQIYRSGNNTADMSSLTLRARNALKKAGINSIEELLQYDLSSLSKIEYCGRKTIKEIENFISNINNANVVKNKETNDVNFNYLYEEFEVSNNVITSDINGELINKYKDFAKQISDVFLNWPVKAYERDRDIFNIVVIDGNTLQTAADKYDLTRGRIRQIALKVSRKYTRAYVRNPKNSFVNDSQIQIAKILLKLNKDEYMDFFYYGFLDFSLQFKTLIFNRFIGVNKTNDLLKYFKDYEKALKEEAKKLIKKEKKVECNSNIGVLLNKIVFPSKELSYLGDIVEKDNAEIYKYMVSIHDIIKKIDSNISVMFNPNVVFKKYGSKEYIPDLLLKLPDGLLVLVIATETLKFAMDYNKHRFKEFKQFCEDNGFGCLIVNHKLMTYEEIMDYSNNVELTRELDKIIEEKGVIFWEDVKEIKETITVTNYDLVKYVDKNNYKLYLQPFLIKKRK